MQYIALGWLPSEILEPLKYCKFLHLGKAVIVLCQPEPIYCEFLHIWWIFFLQLPFMDSWIWEAWQRINEKLGLQPTKRTTNIHKMLSLTILPSNAGSDILLYQSLVLSEIFVKLFPLPVKWENWTYLKSWFSFLVFISAVSCATFSSASSWVVCSMFYKK